MKSISVALSDHLDGEVTTLASCWKIVRRDGVEFFFTDHDRDIEFEGDTYEAESSYDRTAIQSNSDFGVDNLDVTGIIDSQKLNEEELRAGLFNRADVYIFVVNWKNPEQGPLRVRRGWFGEVSLHNNGQFMTEIRGLAQAISHNFIEVYTAECRADFCDERCKLDIKDFKNRATVIDTGDRRTAFTASGLPPPPTLGTSVGAHRYWSIKPTFYPSGSLFFISEVRFRDQEGNLVSNGSAKDNIPKGMKRASKPSKLRDGNFNNSWGFNSVWNDENGEDDADIEITDVRWWIDFGSPVDIKEVEIIATGNPGEAFSAFELQYLDTEPVSGSAWSVGKVCDFLFQAGGQSAVWGIGSAGSSPVSIAETPQAVPAPYTGASTYVGGSLEWVSGRNRGRVVEVLGFNTTTNEISLFEGMGYTIEVGDTFDIAQGCDRTLQACKLYENVINRRAEDYVPGNDEFMKYPDA